MKFRKRISNAIIYIILSILALIWILPIGYLVLSSFRVEQGSYFMADRETGKQYVMPKAYTLNNYKRLFSAEARKMFDFPRWMWNTFKIAFFTCVISTVFVLFTSYALSRLRFKMRRPLMNVALVLGMFPGFMSIIAIYHLIGLVPGLAQSHAALIMIYSGGAGLSYFIMKGFFDTIPFELDEAAYLDGCTKWQTFIKVTVPLAKPVVTYTVLTTFMVPWVDFIVAGTIMKDKYENFTVAYGLFEMIRVENINVWFTTFLAGAVLVSIPIAILFLIMQRSYVEGVTGGAVKG
ncbi:MAG: sugar ABC transporter permease [Clostridiales bacterium]|nr:sugar ABC transporter permease [Clostridiales bacterium]